MAELGPDYEEARALFDQVATGEPFVEFLTVPAYEQLVRREAAPGAGAGRVPARAG
jgi:hypothetical protein